MVESDDELDIQRELDTRDSLASMARYHAHGDRAYSSCDRCVSRNPVGRAGKAVAAWPLRSIHTFIGCGIAS